MKKSILVTTLIIILVGITTIINAKVSQKVLSQGITTIAPMLKRVTPAVVNIVAQGDMPILPKDPFTRREIERSTNKKVPMDRHFVGVGSGVIIDAEHGFIVTNAHVVNLAKNITVTLKDGRHFQARPIGADNDSDIAVIQIPTKKLTELPLANSNQVKVGDFVAAIGSPLGLQQSVTSGIVSALHRSDLGIEGFENFIQTDAPINMGNSGGALVNMHGNLVGINTALLSTTSGGNIGIGFAVPSNMVKSIVEEILKFGKVHRGLMGVLVQTLTPDLSAAFSAPNIKGAIVSQIVPFSPAQQAKLQVGDIITAINNQTIQSSQDVQNTIGLLRVGDQADLTVIRGTKKLNFSIKTADPKVTETNNRTADPYLFGVLLENITIQSPYHGRVQGIRVLKVDQYSPAWTSGLRPGDIIISANHKKINTIVALRALAKPNPNGLLLNLLRGRGAAFIIIK